MSASGNLPNSVSGPTHDVRDSLTECRWRFLREIVANEVLRDDSGAIVQWYGVSLDIDEQVRSKQALRESERTLRQLVETLLAMIDCATPDGEPIYRSQQLREFLGYNLEELDKAGKARLEGTLDAGVHRDDVAGVKKHYAHSLATGEPYARKHRLRRFDGEYRWVETRAAAMRNADGQIVQWNVICLDIDGEVRAREDLRLAQDRLARASQAASLAELSTSIAHEVSQPLAAVLANSHASQRWLATDPPNMSAPCTRSSGPSVTPIPSPTSSAAFALFSAARPISAWKPNLPISGIIAHPPAK